MRKQYDEFIQMKQKDMCKSISDMTFTYINPDTQEPTRVPPSHYEKILNQVVEKYMDEYTSNQFLSIMYNQLNALKKENEKYFNQALLCMDLGINPKDLRIDEQLALGLTYDFMENKQKAEKKNFHLLNQDIVDNYNKSKENPIKKFRIMEGSRELEEIEEDDWNFEL